MIRFVRNPFTWLTVLFALAWLGVFAYTRSAGLLSFQFVADGLSGDPFQYDVLARSLVTSGTFSLDGVTPFFEREPGFSIFLAAIYLLFGVGSHTAVFLAQAVLHVAATYVFVRSVKPFLPNHGPAVLFGLLLFSPPVFHTLFSLTRESLALSLTMFFTALSFALLRRPSMWRALLCGAFLGVLIVVNIPLLLFPVGFGALLLFWRVPWKHVALSLVVTAAVIAPWGIRNYVHRDMLCLTGCYRAALQWHVRGEQAEHIPIGSEPAQCLWAEYVSRDWTGRSEFCSFNAVWHAQWPEGFVGVPEDAAVSRAGQAKILAHLPSYLWFSLFEILELHLPYVNGWGRIYNLSAILWTAIVYLGCALSVPLLRRKDYLLFAAFIAYATALFALTDATPRYLVPILHCYAFLAVLGYTGLQRLWQKSAS